MNAGKVRSGIAWIASAISLVLIVSLGISHRPALALDNPHNKTNCTTCHQNPSSSWWTDQGASGGLCGQCHHPGSGIGHDATPHTTSATYGSKTIQCTVCHNPHYQRQYRAWRATDGNSYRATGVSTGVTALTLTKTGAGWDPIGPNPPGTGGFTGMVLIPDIRYLNHTYRIASNTVDTITIDNSNGDAINLSVIRPGATFAVIYGRLVKEAISGQPVKFFRKDGPNSFADGDAVIDGVCQVCHARTTSFTQGGVLEGSGHPANKAGVDCTQCHSHASSAGGFVANCFSCHGTPPTATSAGGPDGLAANEGGTGSTSPGAHQKHAVSLNYSCDTCHSGGMPQSVAYDKNIQIGFTVAGGGTYVTRTNLPNGFAYTAGNGQTTLTASGTAMSCVGLYCHSNGTPVATGVIPNAASPAWDGGPTTCGSCHGEGSASGLPSYSNGSPKANSHTAFYALTNYHHYAVDCAICHDTGGDKHVNGSYDFNTSNVLYTFDPAGGQLKTPCGCHEIVRWGKHGSIDDHSVDVFVTGTEIRARVLWSDSGDYVDYGPTPSYGNSVAKTNVSYGFANYSVELPNLQNHTTYHYRIRSSNSSSITTLDMTFPVDIFPIPWVTAEPDLYCSQPSCDVTFAYGGTYPGALEYYVEVDDDALFGSPDYVSGWIQSTTWTRALASGKLWRWRVKARSIEHPEDVSERMHFCTAYGCSDVPYDDVMIYGSNPPPAPALVAEPDHLGCGPEAVTFEWNAVTDPDGDPVAYNVQVCQSTVFGNCWNLVKESGWISSTAWTETLDRRTYYFWRVEARDANHPDIPVQWSGFDSFSVYAPAPAVPTAVDEPDAVSASPYQVTLEWSVVAETYGPVEYSVQVDDDYYFGTPDYASGWVTGTNWTVTVASAKKWYWRVQARYQNYPCVTGQWSNAFTEANSFQIYSSNPSPAPVLIDEPDITCTPGSTIAVTLEWSAVIDPDGDPVEYYVDFAGGSGWITGASRTFNITCYDCSSYGWRTKARDASHPDAVSTSAYDSFSMNIGACGY